MTTMTTTTAPSIEANTEDIRSLANLLRTASADATNAADSVHHGLGLGDLTMAGVLDPGGAISFERAAARVLLGPFGLASIEDDLEHLTASLGHAAEGYLEADLLVKAELAFGPLISTATGLIALIPPDSTPTVTPVAARPDAPSNPPRKLSDLMSRLAYVDNTREPGQGEIDIETLTGRDATGNPVRKVIAYLPGVNNKEDKWDLNDTNSLASAARPVEGESSTYEYGVLQALRQNGVKPTDDVTFVGHSQGGAVAIDTARDAVNSGQFNVTHVITAGAPIGIAAQNLPSSVKVLAIENRDDPIPLLDGRGNPVRPNITTVHFNNPNLAPLDSHDLTKVYLPATKELENSGNSGVDKYVDSDSGLFELDQSSTTRYSITGN
jgi:Lipase (class 3)